MMKDNSKYPVIQDQDQSGKRALKEKSPLGTIGLLEHGTFGAWYFWSMGLWEHGTFEAWDFGSMGICEHGTLGA